MYRRPRDTSSAREDFLAEKCHQHIHHTLNENIHEVALPVKENFQIPYHHSEKVQPMTHTVRDSFQQLPCHNRENFHLIDGVGIVKF